jgi:uncharacterized membrane protein YbhN (UPF0104 family)
LRWLRLLLPLGLAAHLGLSFWRTDADTATAVLRLSPLLLAGAGLLAFLPWLLNALRLWNWLRWEGRHRAYADCLRIVAAAELGAAVTPTSVGGASVKTAMLTRRGLPLPRALAITAMGSIEDGLFFALAMPPLLAMSGVWRAGILHRLPAALEGPPLRSAGLVLAGLLIVVLLARYSPAGRRALDTLRRAGGDTRRLWRDSLRRRPRAWALNLLLAALQWLLRYSVLSALLAGLGLPVDPLRAFVLQWLCFTLMALVPTPGAMGGAELIFLALFAGELPAGLQALVMSAWRILTFYLPCGAALLLLLGRRPAALWPELAAEREG